MKVKLLAAYKALLYPCHLGCREISSFGEGGEELSCGEGMDGWVGWCKRMGVSFVIVVKTLAGRRQWLGVQRRKGREASGNWCMVAQKRTQGEMEEEGRGGGREGNTSGEVRCGLGVR